MNVVNYDITPMAAPRMTRADSWKQRPVVLRYFAFKDSCRAVGVIIPQEHAHIIFHMPMPKSWSKKKCSEKVGKAHQTKPDVDNMLKAVLDAVFEDDSHVWDIRVSKVWAVTGSIEVREP